MRAGALLLLGATVLGCGHHHYARNAPGNIDVHAPPAELDKRELEEPADPGEQMIVLTGGAFAGYGVAFGPDGEDGHGGYGIGPEVSVQYGSSDRSHADDQFFIFPERALGVNLGWTTISGEGQTTGPLYGELQVRSELVALAGGWAWDPTDETHGPQLTFALGPLYFRGTRQFDRSTELHAGVMLKFSSIWLWSR
jgi:hypothetical protein